MNSQLLFYVSILFLFFTIQSCKTKNDAQNKKIFKTHYYPSGKLKNSGWYIKDSMAVDTNYNFYENGKIQFIEVRDDSGYSNGETKIFFEKGNIEEIQNYKKNTLHGFNYRYNQDGFLYSKVFNLNNKQVGDCYWYHGDGVIVRKYGFYDFENHNRNLVTYDSIGSIRKDLRPIIYVDTIRTYIDSLSKAKESFYDVLLVMSNPPKCHTGVTIDYLKNSVLMQRDIIKNKQYYFTKNRFSDSITYIKYSGIQYDSIKQKSLFQAGSVTVDN